MLQWLHGVLLGGASSLLLGLVSSLLLKAQQKLTGLLGGCWCRTHQLRVKGFAHLSLQQPQEIGVMVTVILREETRGGQVGPLPAQEVAVPGFEHSL